MPEELSIPIWSKGINFKVYRFDKDFEYEELIKNLAKYKGSIDKKTKGWIIDAPYLDKYDEYEACIIFMSFNKDANPSRLYRMDILKTDPIGCIFDFKDRLIIASTANRQKLASIIESKAFIPIRDITRIDGCSYSGDFLFWLVYNFDTKNGEIAKDIKIDDLSAIVSGREAMNMSNAIKTNTQVVGYTETKVILGLSGYAQGLRLDISYKDDPYMFNIYIDGRINSRVGSALTEVKDKANYAKQIHKIIQRSYDEYNKYIAENKWAETKVEYCVTLLKDAITSMTDSIEPQR